MKRKLLIIVSLFIIGAIVITGCGGSGGSTDEDEAITETENTLESLVQGIGEEDEFLIGSAVSDDGVTVNSESGEDINLSKDEFVDDAKNNPEVGLLFNLSDKTFQVDGDTVTVTGETFTGLQTTGPEPLAADFSRSMTLDYRIFGSHLIGDNTDIIARNSYTGNSFSIEYPDNWYKYSFAETNIESLIAISRSQIILMAFWQDSYFSDDFDLNDFIEFMQNTLEDMEDSTSYPNIDNVTLNENDTIISNSPAKEIDLNYDYNYYPVVVELKFEKQQDDYYITGIKIRESSTVKTVSGKEKIYAINHDDDLYYASYGGNAEDYNSGEATNILDSFNIN